MSLLLDLTLAGSRIATGVGVALIAVAVVVLLWMAMRGRRQPVEEPTVAAPRPSEAAAVRRHRHTSRRSARPVVRHPAVDEATQVLPALRDQTELIPRTGGSRRG